MITNKNDPTVFISYSHHDRKWVENILLTNLENTGIRCHIDFRDFEIGKPSILCMEKAVEKCEKAILVISNNWIRSEFALFEGVMLQTVSPLNTNKKIIPIMIEKCELPLSLKILNYADFTDTSKIEIQLNRVIKNIKSDVEISSKTLNYHTVNECDIDIVRLPQTGFELFGRHRELTLLNEAWESSVLNVISLVAYGGVGKSTLINKWVEKISWDNYKGAQKIYAWSFYSQGTKEQVTSADMFIHHALKWFGDTRPGIGSPWEKGKRLAKLINNHKTLLLLDGLEPLQTKNRAEAGKINDPALSTLIMELAKKNQGLCVITTREYVSELNQYPKTTFHKDLEQISDEAGRKLLEMRRILLSKDELESIVKKFGNHALAINLLGQYLRLFKGNPLEKAYNIPELNLPEEKGRHARQIIEAFSIHFGNNSSEFQLLSIMGFFDRPVPIDAINAIITDDIIPNLSNRLKDSWGSLWLNTLRNLREQKLLFEVKEHQLDTLDCHPLIREYFADKLKQENPDVWKQGHSILYHYYKHLPTMEFPKTFEEMEPLFTALNHGCSAGKHQEVMNDLYWNRIQRKGEYFSLRHLGAFSSNLAALSYFFEVLWEKPVISLTDDFKTDILGTAGFTLRALGKLHEAIQPIKAGIESSIKQENWWEAAVDSENLSELYLFMGNIAEAIDYAQKAVKHADSSNNLYRKLVSRTSFINAICQTQTNEDIEFMFVEAEKMQNQWDKKYKYLYSLRGFHFCDFLLSKGKYQEVLERARYTLSIAEEKGWLLQIALDKLSLGKALMLQCIDTGMNNFSEAENKLNEAIDGLRGANRQDYLPLPLLTRASLFRHQREFNRSWTDLDEAKEISENCSMKLYLTDYHLEAYRNIEQQLLLDNNRIIQAGEVVVFSKMEMQLQLQEHLREAEQLVEKTGYFRRNKEIQEIRER